MNDVDDVDDDHDVDGLSIFRPVCLESPSYPKSNYIPFDDCEAIADDDGSDGDGDGGDDNHVRLESNSKLDKI